MVKDVMSYLPVVADAYDTAQEAAQKMRAYVVGVLPVIERDHLVGIVTDRDLAVRVVAAGMRPWEIWVRFVMTRDPVTCRPDEPLIDAVERMAARRVRRLVVADEAGSLRGMLSVDDLVAIPETQPLAARLLREVTLSREELAAADAFSEH